MKGFIYAFLIAMIPVGLFFTPYESNEDKKYFEGYNGYCDEGYECEWKYGRESEIGSLLNPPLGMSIQVSEFLIISAVISAPVYYLFFREDEYKKLIELKRKQGELK